MLIAYDNRSENVDPAFFVLSAIPHVTGDVRGFIFKFHPLTEYPKERERAKNTVSQLYFVKILIIQHISVLYSLNVPTDDNLQCPKCPMRALTDESS